MTQTISSATLCTLARLLANLALDQHNIPRLQEMGVVRELSHALFFQTASDSASRLSIMRAMRILGTNVSCREEIKMSEGIPGIIDCLKSTDNIVSESSLHTLHTLLQQDRDVDIVQGLVTGRGLIQVVQLCSHDDKMVVERAIEVLVCCASVSEGRVGLNSAGGIECLNNQLNILEPSSSMFHAITSALCASCRDVLGRQRMRDCGGLDRLIQMLSISDSASLHSDILSALVCYYFDEHSLKFMVKGLGLLRALTYQLQQMMSEVCVDDDEAMNDVEEDRMEVSIDNGVNESSKCNTPSSTSNDSPIISGFETTTSLDSSSSQIATTPSPNNESVQSSSPGQPSWSSLSCSSSPSSDIQPQAKRPRLSTAEIEFAHPMPANFIDSLLSSPSPYSTPYKKLDTPLPPDCHVTSLENHVVQLLSRISHLRDCLPYLASRDLLLAMLDCLLSPRSPSRQTHIYKTLARIFSSPHCFQEVISCLIPSRLHQQLSLTPPPPPPPSSPLTMTTPLPDLLDLPSPLPTISSPSPSLSSPTTVCYAPLHTLGYMCRELLTHLSRVGQSPYGQGVLAHLLLTGENKEKTACALATPLLCRYIHEHKLFMMSLFVIFYSCRRVCRKLMVGYNGQILLTQLLTSPPSWSLREWAAESLLALAATSNLNTCLRYQTSSAVTISIPGSNPDIIPCQANGMACRQACRYCDYDHYTFDFEVLLNQNGIKTSQHGTETEPIIHMPAHKSVLMEASEVFNVMLGGHFLESNKSEVYLQNVHPQIFQSILHHLYGCGWLCDEALHHITPDDYQLCNHDDISNSIISTIISNFDLPQEKMDVWHTLHCLATASQYLLDSLCSVCERQAALLISECTIVPLFLYSQLHGNCHLAEECVLYTMCGQHRDCLLELASCSESDTAIDMIHRLISSQLHTPS